jgi:lipopolysaccharide export system permease protein
LIIERYLLREIIYSFLGVTLLLLLIFFSGTLVRILAETAEGTYPADIVFALFGLKSVANLMLVLPLSFFLAVLLGLGRLYKDSEMTVLAACGVGPEKVLRAVAFLAGAISLIAAALALYLAPLAEEHGHQLIDRAEASSELKGIAAGRFNQTEDGRHLLYVEAVTDGGQRLEHIFGYSRNPEGPSDVVTAESARQYTDSDTGNRYLLLSNGYRYRGKPGSPEFEIVQFKEYGILLKEKPVIPSKRRRNAVPSGKLLDSGSNGDLAELQWRISVPISALVLGILAVPLARTTPRQGRYGRLFAGILLYIIYNNLMTVGRAWVGKGQVPPEIGIWWAHLLMLGIALFMFWKQNRMPGPKRVEASA